jgi:hypothetical protein
MTLPSRRLFAPARRAFRPNQLPLARSSPCPLSPEYQVAIGL